LEKIETGFKLYIMNNNTLQMSPSFAKFLKNIPKPAPAWVGEGVAVEKFDYPLTPEQFKIVWADLQAKKAAAKKPRGIWKQVE